MLNLPYINKWNENDLLDNPWNNAQFHTGLMYRNLFLADSSFEKMEGDLAEQYQVSGDGLLYEISIKQGQYWSDGQDLTIDDVIFSIEGVLQSTVANGIYTAAFGKIEGYSQFMENPSAGLAGLEKINGYTVAIHLSTPHPTMISTLAQFAILPAHCFVEADIGLISQNDYWKDPVVSGMYEVSEVVPNDTVTLSINPYYGGQAPQIEQLKLHINYKFANLDYYSTNKITEIINYRSMRSMNEYKVDLLFYRYFVFNIQGADGNQNTAMQEDVVRKAIALSIDRESLLYDIYFDSGTVVDSGVPTTHPSSTKVQLSFDPEMAKELLATAEYDLSRPLRLAYYYTDNISLSFMEAVAEDLEAVGFTVELCPLSTSVELYGDRNYDLLLKGLSAFDISEWYLEYDNNNTNLSNLFGGDTAFDPLVEELCSTVDPLVEDALLRELQDMEQSYLYKIPMFTLSQVLYINEERVNLPSNCSFGNTWYKYDLDFENWSIKKA